MLAAMTFGQEAIAAFCEKQAAFLAKVNPDAHGLHHPRRRPVHRRARRRPLSTRCPRPCKDADKAARMQQGGRAQVLHQVENDFTEEERAAWGSDIAAALKALEKRAMRAMILETGERVDGRTPEEIRPLYIVPGYLPRVHGSGLFQRGQTQVTVRVHPGHAQRVAAPRHHLARQRASATCTSTTSRPTAPARRVAWARRSAARSATAPWPSAHCCRCCPTTDDLPLRHPRGLRGAGVQRLLLHGLHVRLLRWP